jgi:hypothetical protein
MSTSTRTETRASDNSRPTEQRAADTSRTTAIQSGPGRHQEISRWSPDSSSLAPSVAGEEASGTQRASAADSTIAARGFIASNNTSNITNTDSIEAERERARFALEHGGPPAPVSERTAERLFRRCIIKWLEMCSENIKQALRSLQCVPVPISTVLESTIHAHCPRV